MLPSDLAYVLITPSWNEGEMIERTIRSVLAQTVRPLRWVIVDDGSRDGTGTLVAKYAAQESFIQYIRVPQHDGHDFGSKVRAFQCGYRSLDGVEFGFIGNLDADVTLPANYFESILEEFAKDSSLGLAGGVILERYQGTYIEQPIAVNSVAGAVQLFRKVCFEDIDGYRPLVLGGVDALAEIMSRMKGWNVRTFRQLKVHHHRRVAGRKGAILNSRLWQGRMNQRLGYHPLFQIVRCASKFRTKPLFLGGLFMLLGFMGSYIMGRKVEVPREAARFLRSEQMSRLKGLFSSRDL
jgi:biofilm PGA synthesis N-glycosyltransferase PgaC